MQRKSKLNKYVELFKRNISKNLAPEISISTIIYPVVNEGAVFEFFFNKDNNSEQTIKKNQKTVNDVLLGVKQNLVGGDMQNIQFQGTNYYLEENRILIIKGENKNSIWSGEAVIRDVERIISSSQKDENN